jgi:hypothetical protein
VQAKSENFSDFFSRTNELAAKIGLNLSELPEILGFSKPMLFAYRSGKSPISFKAWAALERAERANGIFLDGSVEAAAAVRSSDAKELAAAAEEKPAAADQFPDAGKMIALMADQLAEKDRQIERLLGLLEKMQDGKTQDAREEQDG